MNILKILFKITEQFLFVIIFLIFSTSVSEALDKFNKADNIADYFSGILLLNQSKYDESYKFLKKLENLEDNHSKYSVSYIETLVNNSKIDEAFKFSNKLKKKEMNFFNSDLVILSKLIKNENYIKADEYLNFIDKTNYTLLQDLLRQIISSWVQVEKFQLNQKTSL